MLWVRPAMIEFGMGTDVSPHWRTCCIFLNSYNLNNMCMNYTLYLKLLIWLKKLDREIQSFNLRRNRLKMIFLFENFSFSYVLWFTIISHFNWFMFQKLILVQIVRVIFFPKGRNRYKWFLYKNIFTKFIEWIVINYWFKHLLNCNISAILVAIIKLINISKEKQIGYYLIRYMKEKIIILNWS